MPPFANKRALWCALEFQELTFRFMSGLHQVIKTMHIKQGWMGLGACDFQQTVGRSYGMVIKTKWDVFAVQESFSKQEASLFFRSSLCDAQVGQRKKNSPYLHEKKEEEVGKRAQEREVFPLEHILCGKILL